MRVCLAELKIVCLLIIVNFEIFIWPIHRLFGVLLDPSFYGFTFDLLIKGLIPSDLTDELSKYVCKKDVPEAINLVVSKAIDIFHEDIWAYRCQLFPEKEHTLGIDQSSKTTPSTRSTRQSPFYSFRRLSASPNRWMTWISQSLVQRKPWTDFRIYINC